MTRCALAWTLAAAFALPASAQLQRNFPATALRGEITVVLPPEITLNGQPARLSPGSRIRGTNNMMQMSASLVGQPFVAHYTLDTLGLVHDVWILRPEEIAKKPWPRTPEEAKAWTFDPVGQTWSER